MTGVLNRWAGWCFVHVPKTAGESMAEALLAAPGAQPVRDAPGVRAAFDASNAAGPDRIEAIAHARARDIEAAIGANAWRRLRSFAVVRNPYDRIVSAYRYQRRRREANPRRWAGRPELDLPLDDFILFHCASNNATMVQRLADAAGGLLVTDVLRFEALAADWAALSADLFGRARRLPVKNAAQTRVRHAFSEAAVEAMRRKFADDFAVFGYSPDPPET